MKHPGNQQIYLVLFLFLLFLVELSAVNAFPQITYLIPQLLLLLVVAFALANSFQATLWFGFLAGFLMEFFSTTMFGSMIFAFTVSGISVYLLTRKLTSQEPSLPLSAALVAAQTLLFGVWIRLFGGFASLFNLGEAMTFAQLFGFKIVWTSLSNVIFFYPLSKIYKLIPK